MQALSISFISKLGCVGNRFVICINCNLINVLFLLRHHWKPLTQNKGYWSYLAYHFSPKDQYFPKRVMKYTLL